MGLASVPITSPAHSQHSVQPKYPALVEIPHGTGEKRDALILDWLLHSLAVCLVSTMYSGEAETVNFCVVQSRLG